MSYKIANNNEKYGIVTNDGLTIIPFIHDAIKLIGDNLFILLKNQKWSIINLNTGYSSDFKYSKIEYLDDSVFSYYHWAERPASIGVFFVGIVIEKEFVDKSLLVDSPPDFDIDYNTGIRTTYSYFLCNPLGEEIMQFYGVVRIEHPYVLLGNGWFVNTLNNDFSAEKNIWEIECDGTWDLYDLSGNYIMGGFSLFYRDITKNLLYFYFGGHWSISYKSFKDEPDNTLKTKYFRPDDGKWLITNDNLTPLFIANKGQNYCLPTSREFDSTNYFFKRICISTDMQINRKPLLHYDNIIIQYGKRKEKRCLFISSHEPSLWYQEIIPINDIFAYTIDQNNYIGLIKCGHILLQNEYIALKYINEDCTFFIKDNNDKYDIGFFLQNRIHTILSYATEKDISDIVNFAFTYRLDDPFDNTGVWDIKNYDSFYLPNNKCNLGELYSLINILKAFIHLKQFDGILATKTQFGDYEIFHRFTTPSYNYIYNVERLYTYYYDDYYEPDYPSSHEWTDEELRDAADSAYEGYSTLYLGLDD